MSNCLFQVSIDANQTTRKVSDTLFGLFLEDINFSCDGGLNANMVNNHSFDGVYMDNKGINTATILLRITKRIKPKIDRLRYWNCKDGTIASLIEKTVSPNSWYARVNSKGKCRLENLGYNGAAKHSKECAMSIRKGDEYEFSCWIRNKGFDGKIKVFSENDNGQLLTDIVEVSFEEKWNHVKVLLKGQISAYGKLVIVFEGKGSVDIDCVSFMNTDTWGSNDAKWSQGKLRKDLVETLKELQPTFMRFPGGCIVEGLEHGNEYYWKDSVGPIIDRKPNYNLWATDLADGAYCQSLQVGFYEYFLLCEDLKVEPLPVVWAGLHCQYRGRGKVPIDSKEFQETVVQNALDLIEYANGDPETSKWAKMRADAGHPESFNMKYIGIGNENYGEEYITRFEIVKKAIDKKYPGITCIMSSGAFPSGKDFDTSWNSARKKFPDIYIDEHFYKKPEWLIKNHDRYSDYERGTAKVFLGEYAAKDLLKDMLFSIEKFIPNYYKSALAEAAFLTGVERNSDVVAMTCYAPLLALAGGTQWRHNMIDFNPAHVLKTTNYFVQQMYGATVGKMVVDIKGNLPEGVFASATVSEEKLVIKLVNTQKSPINVKLNLASVTGSNANITYLQSDDLNAVNSLDYRGNPVYKVKPATKQLSLDNNMLNIAMEKYSFYVIEIDK